MSSLRDKAKVFAKSRLSPTQIAALRNSLHNARSSFKRIWNKDEQGELLTYLRDGYRDFFSIHAVHSSNCFYGIEPALLKFSERKDPIKGAIEHGLYVGPFVNRNETYLSGLPAVITFGPRRARAIRNVCDTPVLQLGPYIKYVSSYLDESDLELLKKRLGKVLLVFPSHSIETVDVKFDVESLIRRTEELAQHKGMQSILYCLYFNDVNNGLAQIFDDCGCTVISAGHRNDPLFLSRLRSFIELADVTASNSVGTHMGYCAALGRHHILFNNTEVEKEVEPDLEYEYGNRDAYIKQVKREERLIASAFFEGSPSIAFSKICEEYWGLGIMRSPEELRFIFEGFDRAYRHMRLHGATARESMQAVAPDVLLMLDAIA